MAAQGNVLLNDLNALKDNIPFLPHEENVSTKE